MSEIAGMRKPYNARTNLLLEDQIKVKEPYALFKEWFEDAKNCPDISEPNSMCLATATKDGLPSARFVLCKGFTNDGFKFFTHYTSRKGQELAENPNAALTFYWDPFSRSVRIEGVVEKLPMEEAHEYFQTRSYNSQIGALCSNQSQVISSRDVLNKKEVELKALHKEGEVPLPQFWGGYIVKPTKIEFWQGQTDRIHDRIRFIRMESEDAIQGENGWYYQRLAP